MVLALKGRKSSSSSSRKSTRHDDTLFGQDTVELLLGISEGPIYGLADGASTFYVGDVPLLDKGTQTPNISNFELRLLRGTNPADSIKLNLGGISSTKNVGLDLRTEGQTIVVNCDKTQIDYLDLRFVVQQLFAVSAEGGEFPFDVQFKVEVKPRSASTWQIPFNNEPPPTEETGSGGATYRPSVTTPGMVVNAAYRETYTQPTQPAAGRARGAMWFNTSTQYWTPKIWNEAAWVDPANLVLASEGAFPVWRWLDFDGAQRQAWYSGGGVTPPPNLIGTNDFLLTPAIGEQIYSYNDTAWVGFQSWAAPAPAAPGVLTISGLARSAYPKEYRIPVARINEPYDIRVTRLSPVSTKTAFRNINFESVQEVNRDAISFPDLAVAWLTIKATDTFTSVPDFTGVYRGLVIPVPSNYTFDETTKSGVYTGIWDGSFKMAYTNNPAWHAYNFIMNSRYGKNSYYPEVADKWDYYEFGRHCDAHKFRFNEYITEPRSLNELINYIVGVAGGRYVDRGDGFSTVIWDADDQPALALFTPENIVEGSVTYSFTDITERKNDFRVSFKNPQLNYREDRIRVYDQNHIEVNGRNPEEFVAVGCRDAEEAVRRGRLRLATALTEKTIISFKTNRLGRYLLPFQVFLFADPQSASIITGRVKNADPLPVGASVLPLRDQIYLEAGISYSVQFNVSDGAGGTRIVTYPLTVTTPGLQSQLRLSRALSEQLPEYAVFSIGTPKAYRITSIVPSDGNPDEIDITGIEVNRLKWAFVDGLVELRDILGLQTGPLSKFVYPPTDARIIPEITSDGKLTLLTSWQPSETKLNRGYRVYESINGEPMRVVYDGDQLVYRTQTPVAGTYVHSIVAVGLDGTTESAPITVQYVVANGTSLRSVSMPTNLRLVDEPEAPIFRAVDPRFTWDAAADPLVTKYRVEVLNGANQVVHAETVEDFLQFTYSLAANRADNGGTPLRQFTVQVRAIDMLGNLSQPASLVVSHPAPQALTFELTATSEVVFVSTNETPGDWQGTLVFMEKVSGFNPVTTPPKADNRATWFPMPAEAEQTYYVRVAAYDSYGKTGLNYSVEKTIKATNKLFDPFAPAIPGQPTLTSNVAETAPDGTVTAKITFGWPAVTSTSLATYEIAFAEGNNPAESAYRITQRVSTPTVSFAGLMPGRVYSFKVRSNPKNGFADSGWSAVLVVTAAANTTAPNNPTNFTATAAFEGAQLKWTAPTTVDLSHVEIWGFDGTSTAATPPAGSVRLDTVAKGSTGYADRLPTTGTRTYWLRSVNTSGTVAISYVRAPAVTTAAISAAQLQAGVAEALLTANQIALIKNVTALPTTKTYDYVAYQGKTYRWDATAAKYTAEVAAGDIAGKIVAAQIDTVNAASIAAALAASKIQTDQLQGNLDGARISGSLTTATVPTERLTGNLAAGRIEGVLATTAIPGLDASKITSGTIVDARIASGISAAKVSGDLTNATLATGRLSGTISNDQIASGLSATKLTTGLLDEARISSLTASKIQGALTNATLPTGKLTGTIGADLIAANAILASKLYVADFTNLFLNPVLAGGSRDGWSSGGEVVPRTDTRIPAGAPCEYAWYLAPSTGGAQFTVVGVGSSPLLPVTPGEVFYYSFDAAKLASDTVNVQLYWRMYTAATGDVGTPQSAGGFALTTDWQTFEGKITVPAGVRYIQVGPRVTSTAPAGSASTGGAGVTNFRLRRMASAELVVDGAITALKLDTDSVTTRAILAGNVVADSIASGAIVASKLAVASANLASNGDLSQSTLGWSATITADAATLATGPEGLPSFRATAASLASGAAHYIVLANVTAGGVVTNFPVVAGQWYEASGYPVTTAGFTARMQIIWLNSTGQTVSGTVTGPAVTPPANTDGTLRTATRAYAIGVCPAGAVTAYIRMQYVAGAALTNSVIRGSAFMFANAIPNQTEPSPFVVPGVTSISGGNIIARTITASAIQVGGIIAENIAANAVTASKMVLSDTQNLLLNPTFAQGWEDWVRVNTTTTFLSNAASGDLPAGAPAQNAVKLVRTTAGVWVQNDASNGTSVRGTPSAPGEVFYFEAMVYADVAASVALQPIGYRADGVGAGGTIITVSVPAGVWTKVSGTITMPALTVAACIRVHNNTNNCTMWLTNLRWQRKNGAELIVDGSISARALMIGATAANLIPAGEFLDGLDSYDKGETVNYIIGRTGGPTGGNYLRLSRNGVTTGVPSLNTIALAYVPVEGGSIYEASCYIRADAAYAGTGFRYRLLWYDDAKVLLTGGSVYTDVWNNNQAFTTSWVQLSRQITPPVAARYVRFQVYHHTEGGADWIDIANVSLRRAMTATTIENGAITTDKIQANAITASKVMLTDTMNLLQNGDFAQGIGEDWVFTASTGTSITLSNAASGDLPAGCPAAQAAKIVKTTNSVILTNGQALTLAYGAPCVVGDQFAGELWAYSATAQTVVLTGVFRSVAGATVPSVSIALPAGVWTRLAGNFTCDRTGKATFRIEPGNNATTWVTNARFLRRNAAELIVDGSILASQIKAGEITAREIKAGSLTGDLLRITSANVAYNANFGQGQRGWSVAWLNAGNPGGTAVIENVTEQLYAPAGLTAIRVRTNTNPTVTTGLFEIVSQVVNADGTLTDYTVVAGQRIELSAYVSAHRCTSRFVVSWYNASGTMLSEAYQGTAVVNSGLNSASPLTTWNTTNRMVAFVTVPANAVRMRVRVRAYDFTLPTSAAAYLMISGLMIAPAFDATQTVASPYTPSGATVIDGSTIITDTIEARQIKAGAINASHIVATKIDAIDIIAPGSIKTAQIGAGEVEATNIKAGAVTASKLTISDMSNMVLNGDFGGSAAVGNFDGWGAVTGSISTSGATDGGGKHRLISNARDQAWSNFIDCTPGDVIYVSAMNWNSSSYVNQIYVVSQDAGGGNTVYAVAVSRPANQASWLRLEGKVTLPASARRFQVLLQSERTGTGDGTNNYWGKVQARRAANGQMIVDGVLEARHIKTDTFFANQGVIESLRGAIANFGALGADQIQAGAIGADKLAVGLNTGNLIWNSEREVAGFLQWSNPNNFAAIGEGGTDWCVSGVKNFTFFKGGTNPTDQLAYADLLFPTANGGTSNIWPVQAGQTYEWTCYISAHRCRGYIEAHWWNGSQYNLAGYGSTIENVAGTTVPADNWRARMKMTAPGDAQGVVLRVVFVTNKQNDAYMAASAPYLGLVPPGTPANVYSAYAPQSRTVISGGQIATNSLDAKSIKAGTITSDHISVTGKIQAGKVQIDGTNGIISAINLNAERINAARILVGNGDINSLIAGTNSTKINGGAIQANSIAAQSLRISSRGITPVNINFGMERDSNGNPTRVLYWTGGQIEWLDDNGNRAFSGVAGGRVSLGTSGSDNGWATVWFDKSAPGMLWSHPGNNIPAVLANPNCVLVATTNDTTGVTVNWGGAIIDGDKIIANSIQARNIAADAIQTRHMGFESINGDRITAGTLDVKTLRAGTINTGNINIGSGACIIDSGSRMLRMISEYSGVEQVSIGQVGRFYGYPGDAGIVIRNGQGGEIFRVSGAGAWMAGAIIGDAEITNAKIQNLTIGNEKVQNDAITNGAASIGGAFQRDREVFLNIRRAGTRVGIWVSRTGNPSTTSLASSNPGLLRTLVARPGQGWGDIRQIPNAFSFEYVGNGNAIRHMPTMDMSHYTCDTPGVWGFRVIDDSNSDASAASITVIEFSK